MNFGYISTELTFETLEEIGQEGKNSKVFRSHDKQLNAIIVTKQIEKARFINPDEFFSEARRLYDSSHPNVVQIKYACQDDGFIYLAMPYYKNGSLKRLIDSRPLTVREILRYSIQFLTGLNNIHVKKLIHFDVKPDNVLLSDSNEALISDFGLSKNMNDFGMNKADQVYSYQAPPEAFQQTQHSNLYDIYMAGVTIHRLCNGNGIFKEQVARYSTRQDFINAITRGEFPDRSFYWPHIPKKLRTTLTKAMNIAQDKRPQTVLQLINELSVIDTLLDWKLVQTEDETKWVLDLEDKIFEVQLKISEQIAQIQSSKTMKSSGRVQRVNSGCKSNIPLKDVDKIVQSILLELEP